MTEFCTECGHYFEEGGLWPDCPACHSQRVVHLLKCNFCATSVGVRMDDEYCGPELLICPACIEQLKRRT